jgi:signal transduction histidine kinase/putative methionine-R-sulfoxide reductase with GAF domain
MTASTSDDLSSAERRIQELTKELSEAREQQAATAEILRVISSSPMDPQRVFAEIATSAARLCQADDVVIRQVDDDSLVLVAHHGPLPVAGMLPLTRGHLVVSRVVLDRRTIHVADLQAETNAYPEGSDLARRLGFRTNLAVPLVRGGEVTGVFNIRRTEVRPFTDQQIELLKTFADQAVIAIENARLFEEVQARTREATDRSTELTRALEQQTATSDVLSIISRSPTNVQPVFDTIARSAMQLCKAKLCNVFRFDGQLLHVVASHVPDSPEGQNAHLGQPSIRPGRGSAAARAVASRTVVVIPDVERDPDYEMANIARIGRVRSLMAVPMLKDGCPIGAIGVGRSEAGTYPEQLMELLRTFADQAVIAIENARLFEEVQARTRDLTEALEQQTATADVLKVISRSALDVQKVLDALVESAARLCDAYDAAIWQVLGDSLRLVAHHGQIAVGGPVGQHTIPLVRGRFVGRAVLDRRTIQVEDILVEADEYPETRKNAPQRGWRTALAVPLVHAGEAIGVIFIRRVEVRPFTERQVELVNTFADQAVIAIENTRLFEAEQTRTAELQARTRELTEALEQQTATADVLKVISRSALDVQKVLDALVESAARLCNAYDASIWQVLGDSVRLFAHHGQIPTPGPVLSLVRGLIGGRAIIDRRAVHVADILAEADEYPDTRKNALRHGYRTVLAIPLVHAGMAIGVILIRRAEVRPFTERQIELVNTFADQAVIAIENTRLFEEVQARTRELAKTVEDLEIASQHKNQFVANMSHELRTPLAAILGYAELMQEGFYGTPSEKSMDALTRIRSNGKHLLGLINTVLDIAKIESGQFTLNMSEYAIESVVETVRAATESLAQNKKLTLTTSVDKSLPVGLGDEQRLTQVLLNLVGNAIKFTDAGEVRVTARAVNGHFAVSVTDTGPGIPKPEQTRIFEQFHQVDSSLTRAKGGTGLGLAIAKQIVEMHGGRMWVESTVGEGSTFQMEIPTRAVAR